MSFTSFRAGSGSYQQVRTLNLNVSAVVGLNPSLQEFYAGSGIATNGGSIADLTTDSLVYCQWANPTAADHVNLPIVASYINATGHLTLVFENCTGSTITPTAGSQVNLIVL